MGELRAKRASQRSRTVREDWSAWLPDEMDQLFGATRTELECSNVILKRMLKLNFRRCVSVRCNVHLIRKLHTLASYIDNNITVSTTCVTTYILYIYMSTHIMYIV